LTLFTFYRLGLSSPAKLVPKKITLRDRRGACLVWE
jgi:hypothetical protein